jgi:ribonuclease HII
MWIVGIDEAGYGPNLGPLVMTSVACRVPERLAKADLWHVLGDAVRRPGERDDGRFLVADSKLVYSPARGLLGLETGVRAALAPWFAGEATSLATCLDRCCSAAHLELADEPWYSGATALPLVANCHDCSAAAERFISVSREQRVAWGLVRVVVVCPTRFNRLLDQWDSKGAVLGHALAELMVANRAADGQEPLCFTIDKHGGRNNYAAILHNALPDSMIVAHEEGMARSVYSALGLERDVRLTFQPRADAEHFCVALASMVSKYLRELLMLEFNRFWQEHVPGLEPTAGYPTDAGRFLDAIRPTVQRLGIAEADVWRRK